MTFYELMMLQRDFGQKMPNYRQVPTPNESAKQLNYALRLIGKATRRFKPDVTVALTAGESRYDLENTMVFNRMVWKPLKAIVNGRAVTDEIGRERLVSWRELGRNYPDFRSKPVGQVWAVAEGNREIWYHNAPSQAVIDAGQNYLEGLVFPGVCNGAQCLPQGFPTSVVSTESESSIGSDHATTATVDAPTSGSITGAGNTQTDNGSSATITISGVDFGGEGDGASTSTWARWRAFGLSLPTGAVVTGVRLKALDAVIPDGFEMGVAWTVDGATILQTQYGGPTTTAGGAWPDVAGITRAQVEAAGFGVMLGLQQTEPVAIPLDLQFTVDYLQIEVDWTIPGTGGGSSTGTTESQRNSCVPELEIELHEGLAYCAAIMAAEPGVDDQAVLTRMQLFDRRYRDALAEVRASNQRMASPGEDPAGSVYSDFYFGR